MPAPNTPADAVEVTAPELDAMIAKAVRKAAKAAANESAEQALRDVKKSAANAPKVSDRPGGGGANVNLDKPVRISLSKMIRAIGSNTYSGAELERDFSQAVQGIVLRDDHESGTSFALPSTRSAFMKVIDEANINVGQPKRLREWATRAADFEALALSFLIKGDVRGAQQAIRDANEGTVGAGLALVPPE